MRMGCGCGWDVDADGMQMQWRWMSEKKKEKIHTCGCDVHAAPVKDSGGRRWVAEVLTQHVLWDLENFVQVCVATVHY